MRVVYVTHCARLAGAELALLRLLPALEEVEPHVILGEDGPLVSRLESAGVSTEILPLGSAALDFARNDVRATPRLGAASLRAVIYTARLRARLRRLRPDLVHCNSLKAALYGGVAGQLARVPVVWHAREPLVANGFPPLARRIVATVARTVPDAIIADTEAAMAGFPNGRGERFVVPSPIAVDDLAAVPDVEGDRTALVVGIVGRISPVKGQDVFLRAFARAFPGNHVRAVVVGEPLFGEEEFARQLYELADELGIDDRVTFRGFGEDIAAELRQMDIVVMASRVPEAFGQTVVEGMAAGRAVVAPAAGGPAEVVQDGVTGLLFAPENVSELATILSRLEEDRELRARLGRAARAAVHRFAPEVVASEVLAVYERVLAA